MEIIGDIEKADKFVIYKDDGSIEWVPQLAVAKAYVQNSNNKNWYNKTIHATLENVVKLSDGRLFLQSQAPVEKIKVNNYEMFCSQVLTHIENLLNTLVYKYKYSFFEQILSWKDSSIKEKAELADKCFKYRDELFTYYNTFISKNEKTLKKSDEAMDLSKLYTKFLKDLPKFE